MCATTCTTNNLVACEPAVTWAASVSVEQFHQAVTEAKASHDYGAFVHAYSVEDYARMQLFLLNDLTGKSVAGVAVTTDGDIVSVFKHTICKIQGVVGKFLLPQAVKYSGKYLDCFTGFLPKAYAASGFVPVAKVKFDKAFAPAGWNYARDREPDIIFMIYKPGSSSFGDVESQIAVLPYSSDYNTAQGEARKQTT